LRVVYLTIFAISEYGARVGYVTHRGVPAGGFSPCRQKLSGRVWDDRQQQVRWVLLASIDFMNRRFARADMIRDILDGAIACHTCRNIHGCYLDTDAVVSLE